MFIEGEKTKLLFDDEHIILKKEINMSNCKAKFTSIEYLDYNILTVTAGLTNECPDTSSWSGKVEIWDTTEDVQVFKKEILLNNGLASIIVDQKLNLDETHIYVIRLKRKDTSTADYDAETLLSTTENPPEITSATINLTNLKKHWGNLKIMFKNQYRIKKDSNK